MNRVPALLVLLLLGLLAADPGSGGGMAVAGPAIRLRNGSIETPEPDRSRAAARAAAGETTVDGLFLVQFEGRPDPAGREALAPLGVELLHFIPENAFIARLSGARPEAIRALPFIRWLGPFEPRHKVDADLAAILRAAGGGEVPVRLLLHPGVTPAGKAAVARQLRGTTRLRQFAVGTFAEGTVDARRLWRLAGSSAVVWIEPARRMRLFDEIATKIVAGDDFEAGTRAAVHQLGFDGAGVTVAVADSGLDLGDLEFMHPDLEGRVDALFAYDNLPDASDEHSHGTHVAGIVAGNAAVGTTDEEGFLYGLGVAPGAHIVAQRIFDGQGNYRPPPSFEHLTRDAVRAGAYVGSNSWGDDTQGRYDLTAAEFDALVRDADAVTPGDQQYVLEFSAGNSGPGGQTIGTPAVAKNVIATGATENSRYTFGIYDSGPEVMADFSSRGPAEDGRIKPDIVAPGTWIASLKSAASGEENAWSPIDEYYLYQGGTSQSGPHASGACAVFIQWYRTTRGGLTPSPALVKAALINSAIDMSTDVVPGDIDDPFDPGVVVGDTGPVPNNDEGWGRIDLENLIDSDRRHEFTDQGPVLATGDVFERRVVVGPDDTLKVTLVYTDVPGLPAAIPALVNDLDLEVVDPNGILYRGNAFADGESVAGTPVGDPINNVESVHLSTPIAGEYVVRVRGVNVVQDIRGGPTPAPGQDFALVVSGQLPAPGEGVVSWDRPAYRSPATALLRVVDQQLAGNTSVAVRVSSPGEPDGLTVTLQPAGNGGTFTGTIDITDAPADPADGLLSGVDGDVLTAVYVDADPPGERRATAMVDAQPPAISDVVAAGQFGRVGITWLTGEPADSRVVFGPSNAVTQVVSDPAFRQRHRVELPAVTPGETYLFHVVSTDPAGNTSTNDNGGRMFRFVGPRTATALLVYSPEAIFGPDGILSESPYPGPETWTDTLDQLGVDYEVWDTGARGVAPRFEDLKPYRLVLWRPEELQSPPPGLIGALTAYADAGGSLFIASFDLLSRLDEQQQEDFRRRVLHVDEYLVDQGATFVESVPGDPVGSGAVIGLDYQAFPSGFFIDILGIVWEDGPDHLQVSTNAAPVFLQEDGRVVGLRHPRTGSDSQGRVVYFSFPLEAVPADAPAPDNRATVLGNALEFLLPGLGGISTVAFDRIAYTIPASAVVEVTDARRIGETSVPVGVSVAGQAGPVTVECFATPVPGIFRGRLVLVDRPPGAAPAGPPLPPGEAVPRLPAAHGDRIDAVYLDDAGRTAGTFAAVDTVAPTAFGVDHEPSYNEAYVFWETDKPSDALVRFGESPGDPTFLTRTAYSAELATYHEVLLTGLIPDRDYYYQVVSRDAAGNAAVDDNDGALHRLRTLRPVTPPWVDDLESGRTGWAVFNDDGLTGGFFDDEEDSGAFLNSAWQYGRPVNRFGVTARSGTNCWGTNLGGEVVDLAITDLVSPAVSLLGGNRATLRFWHHYDFTTPSTGDDFADFSLEIAQIAVSADNGASWNALWANPEEASDGWEEVEIDISRYLGRVVRFRFNYQMFSFSAIDRLGWLIDDIGVDINTVPSTLLVVSNNLAQARFHLDGPALVAGRGRHFPTNVPPGDYTITWQPVPFHLTPPPQSGQLGGTTNALVFAGTYTFPDDNRNGISDLWEIEFLGNTDPRPAGTDSDLDGMSDLREFQAGTDPSDPDSFLRVEAPAELPNRTVRVSWNTRPDREYLLEGSQDLVDWIPYSELVYGDGSDQQVTLPALDARIPYYFRVRVIP